MLSMLKNFLPRKDPIPQKLYGAVVAQSRNPLFYTDFGFEDSAMGRFNLLALHMFLLSRRLVREDSEITASLNQEIFDAFTFELDVALRELGVGDPTVPKRKKKMVRSFYGQVEDFAAPMDNDNKQQLSIAVFKRFYNNNQKQRSNADKVAAYVSQAGKILDSQIVEVILKGDLSWPDPANFLKPQKGKI